MNCIHIAEAEQWRIELDTMEADLLIRLFQRMVEHYRIDVNDLPDALQAYWQGRLSAAASDEELKEEQEQLQQERLVWRGERLSLLEKWIEDYLRNSLGKPWVLTVSHDEMEGLLIVLNDRRLILATEHGLDEEQIEGDWSKENDLPRMMVLGEMDILTQFLGCFLMALNPDLKIEGDQEPLP